MAVVDEEAPFGFLLTPKIAYLSGLGGGLLIGGGVGLGESTVARYAFGIGAILFVVSYLMQRRVRRQVDWEPLPCVDEEVSDGVR